MSNKFLMERGDIVIIEAGKPNPTPEELKRAQEFFNRILKDPVPAKQ
jgi:hypothetical protein